MAQLGIVMKETIIWLIKHKASLEEGSLMNEDGSEFMVGTVFIPALNEKEAMDLFEQYLDEQRMKILELNSCKQYDPADYCLEDEDEIEENTTALLSAQDGKIRYIGVSSEAMSLDENETHTK